jgi:hypothetical protein
VHQDNMEMPGILNITDNRNILHKENMMDKL